MVLVESKLPLANTKSENRNRIKLKTKSYSRLEAHGSSSAHAALYINPKYDIKTLTKHSIFTNLAAIEC